MNKFIKYVLISSVSLILVGIIVCFICYSIGGKNLVIDTLEYADENTPFINLGDIRNKGINDKSINVKIGDFEVGGKKVNKTKVKVNESVSDIKVAKNTEIEAIDISFGAGILNIYESDDEYLHIDADTGYEFEYGMNNKKFFLKSSVENIISSASDDNIIDVYLPEGMDIKKIDISCGACECFIEKLYSTKECDIEMGAGAIYIDYIETNDLDVEVGAGDVEIYDMSVKNADLKIGLGSFFAEGEIEKDLEANVSMGSIEINLNGKKEDYAIKANCVMGDIEIDGKSYSGLASNAYINNTAPKSMDLKCSMGSLDINFN